MITHFLGRREVAAYMADLAKRLEKLSPVPDLICALSRSGTNLLEQLVSVPSLSNKLDKTPAFSADIAEVDNNEEVRIGSEDLALIDGKHVFLLDGAIHSGSTMNKCVQKLLSAGAKGICSYSLVIKRGSSFIPTFFGVMIDDTDRAYFLLDEIPNNRLNAGQASEPYAHLRKLTEADAESLPSIDVDVESMDRITWGDRFFDMRDSQSRTTYLLEAHGEAVGYLTVNVTQGDSLSIDEVAVSKNHQGKKYGGILIRFADTLARHAECRTIRLNAISDKIPMYSNFGYKTTSKPPIKLGKESYQPMKRSVLYHISADPD